MGNDMNKTVLEMEISRVRQSTDIIAYAIQERTNEKVKEYKSKEYEGKAGEKLKELLEEGKKDAKEWIEDLKQKQKEDIEEER